MMDCIKNIVGVIQQTTCNCVVDNLPTDIKMEMFKSTSGLYLNDLDGGINVYDLEDLEVCKNYADLCLDSLKEAQKLLYDELIMAINGMYKQSKRNFVGQIGRQQSSGILSPLHGKYQGQRWRVNNEMIASVEIKKISINVNADATFPVYIATANQYDGTEYSLNYASTSQVQSVAGQWVALPDEDFPLTIPLTNAEGSPLDIFIFWDRELAGGASPKNNNFACCGGQRKLAYLDFFEARGVSWNDNVRLASLDNWAHGLSVDVEVKCNMDSIFCNAYQSSDAIKVPMAHYVRYRAGHLVIEKVFKSANISRFTMQNREYLWGKRNSFRAQADAYIKYIAGEIDLTESDCFVCGKNKMFKGGIKA